jgi:hypothetical protein
MSDLGWRWDCTRLQIERDGINNAEVGNLLNVLCGYLKLFFLNVEVVNLDANSGSILNYVL